MIFRLVILVYLSTSQWMTGQNLVPNPSFEIYDKCPNQYLATYRKMLVPGWLLPTGATPDYFNSCTKIQVGVPENFMGYCFAKEGQAYAGIILLFNPPKDSLAPTKENYREYIEAKLTSPMEKGETYHVSFYYAIASYSSFAVDQLGVYITEDKILKKMSTSVLDFKPQIRMDTSEFVTQRDEWFEVTGNYVAKGGEQYITLGNFFNDRRTKFKILDLSGISRFMQYKIGKNKIAYYFIDLVSVTKVEKVIK